MLFYLVVISWVTFISDGLYNSNKLRIRYKSHLNLRQEKIRLHSSPSFESDYNDDIPESESTSSSSFDLNFAESMSKPVPQWYVDSEKNKEKLMVEIEKNRARIVAEFKAKYEISEEEKEKEREKRVDKLRAKMLENNKSENFAKKRLGRLDMSSLSAEEIELLREEEENSSTKERWETIWEEKEEEKFRLPGFFEVFPELQIRWPQWSRRKDGSPIQCDTDDDCPFPQACCPHPILPGDKFCCTGWGQRIMTPAYARQEIQSSFEDQKEGGADEDIGPSWGGGGGLNSWGA